jgi:hypothetical protein
MKNIELIEVTSIPVFTKKQTKRQKLKKFLTELKEDIIDACDEILYPLEEQIEDVKSLKNEKN